MDSQAAIPTATVKLPYVLREKVGNHKSIMVAGTTIREIIDSLEHDFPGLRFNLCYETGELRPYVNIFLNRENIRYLQGLEPQYTWELPFTSCSPLLEAVWIQ